MLLKATKKIHETTPERGRKNENSGGRGEKKSEILGRGPAEGVWRRGVRGSGGGESGERPNFGRTHENFEHSTPTTTHHTTQQPAQGGLGQGGSLAKKSMAQKQDKLSEEQPHWPRFFGVKDGSQRFGHKTV